MTEVCRFKGEFIMITPPLVHLRSEVAATFAQPIDSRDTKLATPQTVVSANSGRWGRLHSAEVLTTLNTRSDPPGLYLKLAPTDV